VGEQAAVPAERSEGNGRPDSSFVEEGGGQQRHPNARAYLGRRQRCVGQHFGARGGLHLDRGARRSQHPRVHPRRRAQAYPSRAALGRLTFPRPGQRRRSPRLQSHHPRVPNQEARAPAASLNGASAIRRVGVAPRSRAVLACTSSETSGQHLIQPPDTTGRRARRAPRRAGWICLCMLHVAQGYAEQRASGRARARRTSPGDGAPSVHYHRAQSIGTTRLAGRHFEGRDVT